MWFSLCVHGCPAEVAALTLMFSRAAMVLCASSNSQLSWETRVSRYFLSLLRLSDCEHTRAYKIPFLCVVNFLSLCRESHRYVKVFSQQVIGLLGASVSLQEATTQREA